MDKADNAEKLLESTSILAENYERLSALLAYPEIIADPLYYKHLLSKRIKIEKAYHLRESLKSAFMQEGENEENDKIQDATDALNRELIRLGDDGTPAAEIAINGNEQCKNVILNAVYEFSRKNGCLTEPTENGVIIKGAGAYSLLKAYVGLHVFEGKPNGKLRVFVFPYSAPEKYSDKDVKLSVFHSDGAGGQNVNKVETAVRATHLPTGITVVCRDERSQLQNKRRALTVIADRVTAYYNKQRQAIRNAENKLQAKLDKVFYYTDGRQNF